MSEDKSRGWYRKYAVERVDGSSKPGGKHEYCEYFVLDIDHDPHAAPALEAYAKSCEAEYPQLAIDVRRQAARIRRASLQTGTPPASPERKT